jgi:hypothetical protein
MNSRDHPIRHVRTAPPVLLELSDCALASWLDRLREINERRTGPASLTVLSQIATVANLYTQVLNSSLSKGFSCEQYINPFYLLSERLRQGAGESWHGATDSPIPPYLLRRRFAIGHPSEKGIVRILTLLELVCTP